MLNDSTAAEVARELVLKWVEKPGTAFIYTVGDGENAKPDVKAQGTALAELYLATYEKLRGNA